MSARGLPCIPEEAGGDIVALGQVVHDNEGGRATAPPDRGAAHPDPRAPGPWMGGFPYPWCTLASSCWHAWQWTDWNGLPERSLRVVAQNQGGCSETGWMECEAGDLLFCPYGSAWNGFQYVAIAFKYVTAHSKIKLIQHGYVADTSTADQLPQSEAREDRIRRISKLTGNCPSEGSPNTTVRTHRRWQPPSCEKWKTIMDVLNRRLTRGPLTRGLRLMCAVKDTSCQGLLMGLTTGDHIVVLSSEQSMLTDAGTATVVRCCKYWLGWIAQSGADAGAIKDFGFCRLSDLEPQRESDHHPALINALWVLGSMPSTGPSSTPSSTHPTAPCIGRLEGRLGTEGCPGVSVKGPAGQLTR